LGPVCNLDVGPGVNEQYRWIERAGRP
jgi:hypothetical protein